MTITREQLEIVEAFYRDAFIDKTIDERGDQFRQALQSLIAIGQQLVDGTHVLVPREPIEAMIVAGSSPIGDYNCAVIYRAMLPAVRVTSQSS
jgi:hypothetical protein